MRRPWRLEWAATTAVALAVCLFSSQPAGAAPSRPTASTAQKPSQKKKAPARPRAKARTRSAVAPASADPAPASPAGTPPTVPNPSAAGPSAVAPKAATTKPAEASVSDAAAAPASAVVKTEEVRDGEKTYTFGAQEVEGRLKSPQILYFLRRVRAQFDPAPLGHRSFLLELSDTRRHPAFE